MYLSEDMSEPGKIIRSEKWLHLPRAADES